MCKSNGWKVLAMKWGFPSIAAMLTAIAVTLVWKHDDLSQLDELVTALAQGIRDILVVVLGAGGVAFGAYQSGRNNGKRG